MFDPSFGKDKPRRVDLSTSTASTSTSLLTSVRAQRLAREQKRREENAASRIQRAWRGRSEAGREKEELLVALETNAIAGAGDRARALAIVLWCGWRGGSNDDGRRKAKILEAWCQEEKETDIASATPRLILPATRNPQYGTVLAILAMRILELAVINPKSVQAANLFATLEVIFDPKSYTSLEDFASAEMRDRLTHFRGLSSWILLLVEGLEKLVAVSLPKRKHPHLQPITRLLVAPFALSPAEETSPLVPPLINVLLAVPSLPSSLPLASLTYLSSNLPLFSVLLPTAAANPQLLSEGRLASELGKTYFLSNLATFGLSGGMLASNGVNGINCWIPVVGTVLSQVGEGWGRWVEFGIKESVGEEEVIQIDSDDDMKEIKPPVPIEAKRQARPPLPPSLSPKLALFASLGHIATLSSASTSPAAHAPVTLLVDFAKFIMALLNAFRGTPKWELILDGTMEGSKGKILSRRVWREGVRGQWPNSGDRSGWDKFAESKSLTHAFHGLTINADPSTPCLVLLTHLYCHWLLITPDDEFFAANANSPLSLDELVEMAGLWRDLAFWGYMTGVTAAESTNGVGTEAVRSLFTRGVTRVAERNARRQFLPDDFWVMTGQMDLKGFVDAAVFEDAELTSTGQANDSELDSQLPRWASARQLYTKRQLAYISPRLGLLNNLPMAVPFQTRLKVFRQFVEADKARLGVDRYSMRRRTIRATVHRKSLAEDGFRQLNSLGPELKGTIQITFIDKYGQEEMGIDGGGLFKEFLTSLSKEAFDTNRGLWLSTDQNELYPHPHNYATEPHQLSWYGFIGRVLGKALYEDILVDVSFAGFFLAKWLGKQSYLDDLNSLDKDLYKGLIILKNYPKPEDLSLNFTVSKEEFGVAKSVDLVPGGSDIPVTAENRHEYIQLVCKYKLDRQIAAQSRAFFKGLSDIIDIKWLRMFDQQELQQLIGGEETLIDMDDLRNNVHVTGFMNDKTMKCFWRVVKRFTQDERKALLRFVTSCSRPPLLGFAYLNPKFGIRYGGEDTTRLPSASACANLLKDEETLRTKLLQAITSGVGFDLS
ncbi:hypothetical protein P7C73_g4335, partial [Tremellales sp. Uapishka_1]